MREPEPRGQKSVDARESAKRLAARTLNTPDLFATCVKQSATSTHLILRSFVITNRGQENSAFDTGPVPSSSPTNRHRHRGAASEDAPCRAGPAASTQGAPVRSIRADALQNQTLQAGFDLVSNVAFANRLASVRV